MSILLTIGAVLFMVFFFGFCVFIHELGHFLAAKWRGLHIVAFSIGFKKAWGIKHKGIDYRIGWLPFGGYVDLPQIDSTEEKKVIDGKELPPAKPIDRIITAAAGPLFNILFGLLLGIAVWHYGIPQRTPKMRAIVVESIDQNSPEYKAGLRVNDKIVKINGKSFNYTWDKFVREVVFTIGQVNLTIKRGDKTAEIAYTPAENPNHFGKERIGYPFFTPKIPLILYPRDGSPAANKGIKKGDLLVAVNGQKVSGMADFNSIASLFDKDSITLTVNRKGKEIQFKDIIPKKDVLPGRYRIGISYQPKIPVKVGKVLPDSPAAKAGLKPEDTITGINGNTLTEIPQLGEYISASKGTPITVQIRRDNKPLNIKLTPEPFVIYDIGVSLTVIAHPNPFQQFVDVVGMSYNSLRGVFYGLAFKAGLTQKSSTLKPRNFSGPIGIGKMLFQSVYYGSLLQGIYFIVIITFSLGMLNIMPLPVLDGGHIMFAFIEMIAGRPLPPKYIQPVTVAFVVFLISFMIYVTVFDIIRIIPDNGNGTTQLKAKKTQQKVEQKTEAKPANAAKTKQP